MAKVAFLSYGAFILTKENPDTSLNPSTKWCKSILVDAAQAIRADIDHNLLGCMKYGVPGLIILLVCTA